jgi:hypothetical protein
MECYLATEKNEIMVFAGKWVELKIIMLSEVKPGSAGKMLHLFPHM